MLSREQLIEYIQATHERTVLHTLGMRIESFDPAAVVVAADVDERLFQPAGIVHGGVYVLMAESAASTAAALTVDMSRFNVSGMEINANHLRPVTGGTLRATSRLVHRGRSTLVYSIDVTDGEGRLVCVSRCTIAVRPWSEVGEAGRSIDRMMSEGDAEPGPGDAG